MVKCGACGGPFLDIAGNERSAEDIAHCCLFCKAPVHSWVQEGCSLWMPVEGYYFCGQVCLQRSNAAALAMAREECENETFGPGADEWDDWYVDNCEKYFDLCQRPGEEPVAAIAEPAVRGGASGSEDSAAAVNSLLSPGTRLQECFKTSNDDTVGSWYGGVVGPVEPDGRIVIGFDDGDLRVCTVAELTALHTLGKLSRNTVTAGLVGGVSVILKATSLCLMKCGTDHLPIGVLLQDCSDKPEIAGQTLYHSHIMSVAAVETAMSTTTLRPSRHDKYLLEPRHRNGYHTFRRGDKLSFVDGPPCKEICYGVVVAQYGKGGQQLRFVISYDTALAEFSVSSWTGVRRISVFDSEDGGDPIDLDASENVQVADTADITAMEATWRSSANELPSKVNSLDKLKKAALLGPAQQRESKAAAARETQRASKARARENTQKAAAKEKAAATKAAAEQQAALDTAAAQAKAAKEATAKATAKTIAKAKEAEAELAQLLEGEQFLDNLLPGGAAAQSSAPLRQSSTLPPPPLPPPPPPPKQGVWKEARTPNGTRYFYNDRTRETAWELPSQSTSSGAGGSSTQSSTHASSVGATASSAPISDRYGVSPGSFTREIRVLKRQHYVLSQEMIEIVDPVARQRQARDIAKLEARLLERGIDL